MMEQVPITDTDIFKEYMIRRHYRGVYPNILMEIIYKAASNGGWIDVIGMLGTVRVIGRRHEFYYVCLNDVNKIVMVRAEQNFNDIHLLTVI